MSKKVLIISSDVESYEIALRMAKVAHFELIFSHSIEQIKSQLNGSKEQISAIHFDVNSGQIDLEIASELLLPFACQMPIIVRTSKHGNIYQPLQHLVSLSFMTLHGNSLDELTQSFILLDMFCEFIGSKQQLPDWANVRDGNDEFILQAAVKASKGNLPVLIEGAIGTPKLEMAVATHKFSNRYRNSLKIIDARTNSPTELMTSIFGNPVTTGLLEEADHGTLFINNLNHFSDEFQSKISSFLNDGMVFSKNERKRKKLDVKLIIATDLDLIREVKSGTIDEALYYRLSVSPIVMTKFNSIADDMRSWIETYIHLIKPKLVSNDVEFEPTAIDALAAFDWPGHHIQFTQVLAWAFIQAQSGSIGLKNLPSFLHPTDITSDDLIIAPKLAPDLADMSISEHNEAVEPRNEMSIAPAQYLNMFDDDGELRSIVDIEEEHIRRAIAFYDGKMSFVARQLGIGRSTLYRKLKEYEIDPDRPLEYAD